MRFLGALLLLLSARVYGEQPNGWLDNPSCDGSWPPGSTMSQGCASLGQTKKLDAELNGAYKSALEQFGVDYRGGPAARDALIEAQRAWIKYRDAVCKFETLTGGANGVSGASCLARLTAERLGYLKELQ